MPSLSTLTQYGSALLAQLPLFPQPQPHAQAPSSSSSASSSLGFSNPPSSSPLAFDHFCPLPHPASCHNHTAVPDSCCFIYPGGQLLQTQFWDTGPSVGPSDSWTLHGLWPDLCDGSYPSYCHSAPAYGNVSAIIAAADEKKKEKKKREPSGNLEVKGNKQGIAEGEEEGEGQGQGANEGEYGGLLADMQKYWLPNYGSAEHFWTHEWRKHGTCINTLAPSCYAPDSYTPGDELVAYFARAVALFKELDTYAALAARGIVPSWTRSYSRAEIEDALRDLTGREPVLGCRGRRLNQAWYSFNVKGSLQDGEFVPSEPVGKFGRGGCPEQGIKYLPK